MTKIPFDKELKLLCRALNHLPGVRTFTSCFGHGKRCFDEADGLIFVGMTADSLLSIAPILGLIKGDHGMWEIKIRRAPENSLYYYLQRKNVPQFYGGDVLDEVNEFARDLEALRPYLTQ